MNNKSNRFSQEIRNRAVQTLQVKLISPLVKEVLNAKHSEPPSPALIQAVFRA
jgi:hypothetical protein